MTISRDLWTPEEEKLEKYPEVKIICSRSRTQSITKRHSNNCHASGAENEQRQSRYARDHKLHFSYYHWLMLFHTFVSKIKKTDFIRKWVTLSRQVRARNHLVETAVTLLFFLYKSEGCCPYVWRNFFYHWEKFSVQTTK